MKTSLEELAVLVSEALEKVGVNAVLCGAAAVSIYSDNAYERADLDFVTSAGKKILVSALASLGFTNASGSRMFEHPRTQWFVEFPAGTTISGNVQIYNLTSDQGNDVESAFL